MEKSSTTTTNELLPEFQKFLRDKKLAPEKNVFFIALWASKFFNYARKKQISSESYQESAISEFLETLKSDPHLADWQIRQASDAIRFYYFHFRGLKPLHLQVVKTGDAAPAALLKETTRLLRLKHYSYSTERTYLQWIKRFLDYDIQTRKKGTAAAFEVDDFKNFISHLALKEKVAASTQNQAFNALLFFFRNVLCKEVGDLGNTIRAKRGQKLPTVLSVEEVKKLLTKMSGKTRLMVELIYGSGLRLMELASLRVKDIDFASNTIVIRSGKGDKDRATALPQVVKDRLMEHLNVIQALHDKDIAAGRGNVYLPDALARKYPNAGRL